MPPITTTAKTTMTSEEPISGRTWTTGAASTPGERRERDAAAVGERRRAAAR